MRSFERMAEDAGIRVELRVESDENAPEAICRVAKEENADLIIMGASGRSSVVGRVLGGVTDKVAARSDCPVLIVPE